MLMVDFRRLMSDYEVTLVNDNSGYPRIAAMTSLSDFTQCMSTLYASRLDITSNLWAMGFRQEFYVRFKGPEESTEHMPT
jgi:hypothetical protein